MGQGHKGKNCPPPQKKILRGQNNNFKWSVNCD